jgi:phosphohistidine phosphatase
MTLSLYVLRHAKAEGPPPAGGGDHERVLKRRGRRAARALGRFLTGLGEAPDLVLSSTAARARETAELAGEAGGWRAPLELSRALYEATPETLLRAIVSTAEGPQRLVLVGHQPGLALLVAELAGSEPEFPTGALARIDFGVGRWSEIRPQAGRMVWLVTPETLAVTRARRRLQEDP